jgi:hypothetical protein
LGDFAYSPALAAGEETWLEGTLVGPFHFNYLLDEPNSRVRLYINNVLQADSNLAPTARELRAELIQGRSYQIKILVTGGKIRLGGFVITAPTPASGSLIGHVGSVFENKEVVFWGENVTRTFLPFGVAPTGLSGDFGIFANDVGTLRFNAVPVVYTTRIILPPASASVTTTLTGAPTTMTSNAINLPGGLICARFTLTREFRTYNPPAWPSEYGADYSEATMHLTDIRIERGKPSLAAWADMKLLGNFENAPDADPDGDGLTNAIEFMLGTNPTVVGGSPLSVQKTPSGQVICSLPAINYSMTGYQVQLQTSPDLGEWTTQPSSSFATAPDGRRTWRSPDSSSPSLFCRLRLVETP